MPYPFRFQGSNGILPDIEKIELSLVAVQGSGPITAPY